MSITSRAAEGEEPLFRKPAERQASGSGAHAEAYDAVRAGFKVAGAAAFPILGPGILPAMHIVGEQAVAAARHIAARTEGGKGASGEDGDGAKKPKEKDEKKEGDAKISPRADAPGERRGDAPTDAEKAAKDAARERTKIVELGEAGGKKVWGQSVPCVMSQWGFRENEKIEPISNKTVDGDQGYKLRITQEVARDKDGKDVIKRRETVFDTPNGVAIYYRDADGNMKVIHNVTSMESVRQPDGTCKITYHVKGENDKDARAPKPVSLDTTADGRHVQVKDGKREPIGQPLDPPVAPRLNANDASQDTVNRLAQQLRDAAKAEDAHKRHARCWKK